MAAGCREGFVEADGFRIRYMEAGEGPAFTRAGTSAIGAIEPLPRPSAKHRVRSVHIPSRRSGCRDRWAAIDRRALLEYWQS